MDNSFREAVYEAARRIPAGKVASFGQLAALCGKPGAARAVGAFMGCCPAGNGVPCHRVIHQDGALCRKHEFTVGEWQRKCLLQEGVEFLPDGRVDMKKARWLFP